MRRLLLTLSFFILALVIFAQLQDPAPPFSSPYEAMYNHLYYLQEDQFIPSLAARSLNIDGETAQAQDLAIKLKQLLDGKGLYVKWSEIPKDSAYLDSTGRAQYVPFPNQLPEIYLATENGQWFYSPEAVAMISSLHQDLYPLGADILVRHMPKFGQKKSWVYSSGSMQGFFCCCCQPA